LGIDLEKKNFPRETILNDEFEIEFDLIVRVLIG